MAISALKPGVSLNILAGMRKRSPEKAVENYQVTAEGLIGAMYILDQPFLANTVIDEKRNMIHADRQCRDTDL